MTKKIKPQITLGVDYTYWNEGPLVPLNAPLGHLIVVGGTGSGKTTALLYWLCKMKIKEVPLELHIMDFKASHEFCGITGNYAEFESCYDGIATFYKKFLELPEGGDGTVKLLLIDEIAGMLMHFGMTKEGKAKADEIRIIMSSILMLGRSKNCFLWLAMQRYTATIFPASSGAADNFQICVGLGRLSVDSRKSLFAGEHLEKEDEMVFGQGTGIVLIDGQPLYALLIPKVSKRKMLKILQK